MAKVEVIIRGKAVKVEQHMLNDLAKFGVTQNRRTIVPVPKEIIQAKLVVPEVNKVVPEVQTPKDEPISEGHSELPKEVKAKPRKATTKLK